MKIAIYFKDDRAQYKTTNSLEVDFVDPCDISNILCNGYVGKDYHNNVYVGIPAHKIILIYEIKEEE